MASAPEPGDDQVATLHHYPVVTPCDLCETKEDVNSFCRNCSQNLCDGCKRLHQRSTVSRDHNVVHISEGKSSESEATSCTKHGERLFFYCRTRSVLFCPKCLNPTHKNHDFLDTDEYAKELQSKVTAVIMEKSKEVEESGRNIQHIEEKKQLLANTFINCKTSVLNAAKLIHSEVDRVKTKLLSTISHHESQCLAKFDEVKQEEKSAETELQESLDKLLHHSKKHDNISLIAHADRIIDDAQAKRKIESDSAQDIAPLPVPILDFRASNIQQNAISRLFGTLHYQPVVVRRKYAANETKKLSETQMNQTDHSEVQKQIPPLTKHPEFCKCNHPSVLAGWFVSPNKCSHCHKTTKLPKKVTGFQCNMIASSFTLRTSF